MSVDVSPFEVASAAGPPALRAVGVARLKAERIAGQTVAMEIDEQGPLRLRFPRIAAKGVLEGVMVNTGGGIVGGDKLEFEIEAGEGASLSLTSQASEKIYRSDGADAKISVQLTAQPRSNLAWLPQEAILFDRARVARRIEADVAKDASLTICESVIFGRAAMGETVNAGSIRDRWHVRRDGKLIFADALTLDGPVGKILKKSAVAGGANAVATLLQVAPGCAERLDAVRASLAQEEVEAGASAFDGILIVRILAQESMSLRSAILSTLSALGANPPRAFSL
jgi:urease accessory protein